MYARTDKADRITLREGDGTLELLTLSKSAPYPQRSALSGYEVNITHLLQNIDEAQAAAAAAAATTATTAGDSDSDSDSSARFRFGKFSIDRDSDDCRTPRRNKQVDAAISFWQSVESWSQSVNQYFFGTLFPIQQQHSSTKDKNVYDVSAIRSDGLYVPIVPFFEERNANTKSSSALTDGSDSDSNSNSVSVSSNEQSILQVRVQVTMTAQDIDACISEQKKRLDGLRTVLKGTFPASFGLINSSAAEVNHSLNHSLNH